MIEDGPLRTFVPSERDRGEDLMALFQPEIHWEPLDRTLPADLFRRTSQNKTDSGAVDVVIVNWNTAENAIRAAHAFGYSSGVETRVKVVDNDSEPDQRRLLKGQTAFELIEAGITRIWPGGQPRRFNRDGTLPAGKAMLISHPNRVPSWPWLKRLETKRSAWLVRSTATRTFYHDNLPSAFVLLVRTLVGGFCREPIPPPGPGQELSIQQPSVPVS